MDFSKNIPVLTNISYLANVVFIVSKDTLILSIILMDLNETWHQSATPVEFLQYLEKIQINWQYTFSCIEIYGLCDGEPCQLISAGQKSYKQ